MKIIGATRVPELARKDWGFKVWGGNHKSEARFARSRPAVTRPNPKPQSLLAAVTNRRLLHTLTLTLTLKP